MTNASVITSTDLIASGGDDGIEIETHSGGGGGGQINGTSGNDVLKGTSGDDTFFGGGGDDTIDGGAGRDVALYSGDKSQYTVTTNAAGAVVVKDNVAGRDGTDTLTNVERIKFGSGGNIDFDASGHGGEAYRLYQAAFDRAPDTAGLGYWVKAMDGGASLHDVAQTFLQSPEFAKTYGSLDTGSYVTQLYQNVLHRSADRDGESYWEHNLSTGAVSRADVLMYFSESPENQAALVGTIKAGISY